MDSSNKRYRRWLQNVTFTDLNNGTTVGGGDNDTTEEGIILRTTNGGMTWFQQTSGITHNLAGVSFTDSNNGWAVGGYRPDSSGFSLGQYFIRLTAEQPGQNN